MAETKDLSTKGLNQFDVLIDLQLCNHKIQTNNCCQFIKESLRVIIFTAVVLGNVITIDWPVLGGCKTGMTIARRVGEERKLKLMIYKLRGTTLFYIHTIYILIHDD